MKANTEQAPWHDLIGSNGLMKIYSLGMMILFMFLSCQTARFVLYDLYNVGIFLKFDGDEIIQYSKLITVAVQVAVKSGAGLPEHLYFFICGSNTLKGLFLEAYLNKYIGKINMEAFQLQQY